MGWGWRGEGALWPPALSLAPGDQRLTSRSPQDMTGIKTMGCPRGFPPTSSSLLSAVPPRLQGPLLQVLGAHPAEDPRGPPLLPRGPPPSTPRALPRLGLGAASSAGTQGSRLSPGHLRAWDRGWRAGSGAHPQCPGLLSRAPPPGPGPAGSPLALDWGPATV